MGKEQQDGPVGNLKVFTGCPGDATGIQLTAGLPHVTISQRIRAL
jgi:hypothetical protein